MKIFFPIRAFYPSQVGGPSNALYWHTCALKEKGVDVRIVTTTWGIKEGEVEEDGWMEKECGKVYYGKGTASTPRIIIKALAQVNAADILHLNSLFHGLSIAVFVYARLFFPNKKIIWSVRGELNPEALRSGSRKKKKLLSWYKKFNKRVAFHSTSAQETLDIRKRFPDVEVVEIPNFLLPEPRMSLETKKQFLYMGRIHPIKALDKLIKGLALSHLFVSQGFRLVLVGTHTLDNQVYVDGLHRLISELNLVNHVEFKGHVTGKNKEVAYAESFALILPSESENFGNVVVEAMNHGTPVIASKGTPWAILEERRCGYHIENSPKEIAKALDKMISQESQNYILMRENAIRLVDDQFNIRSKINLWTDQYQKLLNR